MPDVWNWRISDFRRAPPPRPLYATSRRSSQLPASQPANILSACLQQLPLRYQLACEGLLPGRVAGDNRIIGSNIAVRLRVKAWRCLAALDRADRFQHEAAQGDDRLVGGGEVLLGTIDDRTHAFL